MSRIIVSVAFVTLILPHTSGHAGIGIFSTPDGTNCNLNLLPGLPQPLYVLYLGDGGPMANGAEYHIDGMPGTWNVQFLATLTTAPGSNLNLGHAFDGTGHNVAWPAVQPFDGNGNLLLATYTLIWLSAPAVPAGTILKVAPRHPCVDGACCFCCPLITDVGFNLLCQAGGEMRVNGGPACTVAVEQRTWTQVRNLYR